MLNGLPSIAAAVVVSRRKPIWVRREKAMAPLSCSHQRRASEERVCSGAAKASQTLISGKLSCIEFGSRELDEIINLCVRELDAATGRANQGWIEAKSALRPPRFALFHSALDTHQDQLAGRTAFTRRRLMQAAMQIARKIDRRADRRALHRQDYGICDLNKSKAIVPRKMIPHPLIGAWGFGKVLGSFSARKVNPSEKLASLTAWKLASATASIRNPPSSSRSSNPKSRSASNTTYSSFSGCSAIPFSPAALRSLYAFTQSSQCLPAARSLPLNSRRAISA